MERCEQGLTLCFSYEYKKTKCNVIALTIYQNRINKVQALGISLDVKGDPGIF